MLFWPRQVSSHPRMGGGPCDLYHGLARRNEDGGLLNGGWGSTLVQDLLTESSCSVRGRCCGYCHTALRHRSSATGTLRKPWPSLSIVRGCSGASGFQTSASGLPSPRAPGTLEQLSKLPQLGEGRASLMLSLSGSGSANLLLLRLQQVWG